jgi:hypothetical protein
MTVKEQSQEQTSLAKYNFLSICKSPAAQETYFNAIHYYMDFIKVGHEDLGKLLDEDPKLIQMDICRFVTELLKYHSPATISSDQIIKIKYR